MKEMKDTLQTALSIPTTLYSIFDRVAINRDKHEFKEDRRSALPKAVLNADGLAAMFKRTVDTDLKGHFDADLDHLINLSESAHADTLPYLFQKYGWRIAAPEDPEKHPDAAFCDRYRAEQALENPGTSGGYLLVKGDLTGIQEYIYHNIQGKKTGGLGKLAKRLRARSVLVSLLTDFVANVILRELGMSSWHLLFAGGGHFNLLLPEDREADLNVIASKISAALRHQYGERLELIMAYMKYDRTVLESKASECFASVNARRDELKHRQHLGGLSELFNGRIDNSTEKKDERDKWESKIGGVFPKQRFLLEITSKSRLNRDDHEHKGDIVLAEFELSQHHTLLAVKSLNDKKDENSAHRFLTDNKAADIRSALILALNDTDFLPKEDWKSAFEFPVSFGFRFLGKNAPTKIGKDGEEEILDFSELAGKDKDNPKIDGFVRLGSLMLDVDNLGLIFSHGIKDASLAQIITLSREVNYFFTAHFDQRARENRVYVVYSGGDDAFAVGKWDMLMRFAKTLREDFQKFICYGDNRNDDVHFSAGIFMSNPHYPVGRFYQDTKDLQERGKNVEGKNCVDVFGHTLEWNNYTDKIILGDQLYNPLKHGVTLSGRKFSASFAYRIMQLVKTSYYDRGEWDEKEKKYHKRNVVKMEKFSRNVALMRYLFAKNGFTETEIERIGDDCEKELIQSFLRSFNFEKPYEARDYLVALNFAMLQVRSTSKNI
jgi:CRISPR-associated protein Csm1